jgi:hypothetical protein
VTGKRSLVLINGFSEHPFKMIPHVFSLHYAITDIETSSQQPIYQAYIIERVPRTLLNLLLVV